MAFSVNLSEALKEYIKKNHSTQLKLAEASNLSHRFVGDIIRGDSIPTLKTFEQICAALEVTPNDLLLKDNYENDKPSKMVTQILCIIRNNKEMCFSICPGCNSTLEREYQAYCDRCGTKLNWKNYDKAEVIYFKK